MIELTIQEFVTIPQELIKSVRVENKTIQEEGAIWTSCYNDGEKDTFTIVFVNGRVATFNRHENIHVEINMMALKHAIDDLNDRLDKLYDLEERVAWGQD